jgi:hypothetical protein
MGHWRGLAMGVCMLACAGCLGGGSLGDHHPVGSGGSRGTGGLSGTDGEPDASFAGTTGTGSFGAGGAGPARFCGEYDLTIYPPARPAVLLLLDRSSSMNDDSDEMHCTGGCGAVSKWALLSAAIDRVVSTHPSVNWGLALFGSDDACGVNAGPVVDVAEDAASSIAQALKATTPGGDAPTAAAIDGAVGYLESGFYSDPKYILLATDGRSGCATGGGGAAGADVAAEEAITRARFDHGVSTFVLGLAPAWDATATATLNQMAENGGEGSPRTPTVFATLDTIDTQLSVLSSMIATSSPCAFALPYPVGPQTTLAVSTTTVDGLRVMIPQDPIAGWSFTSPDELRIQISGSVCSGLQSGAYNQVTIMYACRIPPPGRSPPIAR